MGQDTTGYEARLRTHLTNQYGRSLATPKGTAATNLTHLVYTRDAGGKARFYVNGLQRASSSVTGNFSNWGKYVLALANEPNADKYNNSRPWLGELHLIAVYNRALNATEVDANFEAGPDLALQSGNSSGGTDGGDTTSSGTGVSGLLETAEIEVDHQWQKVYFAQSFDDPVVVAKSMSYNDSDPAVVRIRNVKPTSFEIRVQEWDYLDGSHTLETVSYLAMEKGSHTLSDGTRVEAGRFKANHNSKTVAFGRAFNEKPVVLSTVTSFNGGDTVVTRMFNIGKSSFKVQMQEQEASGQSHATEWVNYLAWEPSAGVEDGMTFEVARTGNSVTHQRYRLQFKETFLDPPMFLADMQTMDGADTASVRWDNKDIYDVDVWIVEEQSGNSETTHTTESLGYILVSP
jgi:hypothetical protein